MQNLFLKGSTLVTFQKILFVLLLLLLSLVSSSSSSFSSGSGNISSLKTKALFIRLASAVPNLILELKST